MKITECLDIHPDIVRAETEHPHGTGNIIRVYSPGTSYFGDKVEHTVTIEYECNCNHGRPGIHHHDALYGPRVVHFSDDCVNCGIHKYASHAGHEYVPMGEEVLDMEHMTLYAD